jgi:hypothetical protein
MVAIVDKDEYEIFRPVNDFGEELGNTTLTIPTINHKMYSEN